MRSGTSWVLQVDPAVYAFLKRIPRKDAEWILSAMEVLTHDPFSGDIQKMRGQENIWRRRIGAYRMKYELIVSDRTVHVFRVERRTSKTY
jgi:mRNA-degrading endonuclease RelE of RelBE toxin-antitoxin system